MGWLQGHLCSNLDVTEAICGRGLPRLLETVESLCRFEQKQQQLAHPRPSTLHDTTVSLLLLGMFVTTVVLLVLFPPPE